jgi:hypothetical protein
MRLLTIAIVYFLCVGQCLAEEMSVQWAGRELMICYNESARLYATETCEPSSSLIEAIFGRCTIPEGGVRRAMASEKQYESLDAETLAKLADATIARIRKATRRAPKQDYRN